MHTICYFINQWDRLNFRQHVQKVIIKPCGLCCLQSVHYFEVFLLDFKKYDWFALKFELGVPLKKKLQKKSTSASNLFLHEIKLSLFK